MAESLPWGTGQRLLSPVHDWAAGVLSRIRMDGTFNQARPLSYLVGIRSFASYDFSKATDRWPLVLMFHMFASLFDRSYASSVVNSALALFFIPFFRLKTEPHEWISFVAGQPLGYKGSWPLFALSHHFIMWWCAEQVWPGRVFRDYAILGDDVVIGCPKVATKYREALEEIQVSISLPKSLVSDRGCLEFAKRVDSARPLKPSISFAFLPSYV